jgi:hypothetical protein
MCKGNGGARVVPATHDAMSRLVIVGYIDINKPIHCFHPQDPFCQIFMSSEIPDFGFLFRRSYDRSGLANERVDSSRESARDGS